MVLFKALPIISHLLLGEAKRIAYELLGISSVFRRHVIEFSIRERTLAKMATPRRNTWG
jgi:hypothetical protein